MSTLQSRRNTSGDAQIAYCVYVSLFHLWSMRGELLRNDHETIRKAETGVRVHPAIKVRKSPGLGKRTKIRMAADRAANNFSREFETVLYQATSGGCILNFYWSAA